MSGGLLYISTDKTTFSSNDLFPRPSQPLASPVKTRKSIQALSDSEEEISYEFKDKRQSLRCKRKKRANLLHEKELKPVLKKMCNQKVYIPAENEEVFIEKVIENLTPKLNSVISERFNARNDLLLEKISQLSLENTLLKERIFMLEEQQKSKLEEIFSFFQVCVETTAESIYGKTDEVKELISTTIKKMDEMKNILERISTSLEECAKFNRLRIRKCFQAFKDNKNEKSTERPENNKYFERKHEDSEYNFNHSISILELEGDIIEANEIYLSGKITQHKKWIITNELEQPLHCIRELSNFLNYYTQSHFNSQYNHNFHKRVFHYTGYRKISFINSSNYLFLKNSWQWKPNFEKMSKYQQLKIILSLKIYDPITANFIHNYGSINRLRFILTLKHFPYQVTYINYLKQETAKWKSIIEIVIKDLGFGLIEKRLKKIILKGKTFKIFRKGETDEELDKNYSSKIKKNKCDYFNKSTTAILTSISQKNLINEERENIFTSSQILYLVLGGFSLDSKKHYLKQKNKKKSGLELQSEIFTENAKSIIKHEATNQDNSIDREYEENAGNSRYGRLTTKSNSSGNLSIYHSRIFGEVTIIDQHTDKWNKNLEKWKQSVW